MAAMSRFFERRIREMIATADRTPCWPYWKALTEKGYARVGVRRDGRSFHIYGHRLAYEILTGQEVPRELDCDHLCRNQACVNPFHVEPVSHFENMRRWADSVTHCKQGHPFSPENTRMVWNSSNPRCRTKQKTCITCTRTRNREAMRRKYAAARAAKAAAQTQAAPRGKEPA
jgi:hypothetical protein